MFVIKFKQLLETMKLFMYYYYYIGILKSEDFTLIIIITLNYLISYNCIQIHF